MTFNFVFQTAVKYPDYNTGYSKSLFKDPDDFKPARRVRGNSQTLNITCGRTGTLGIMSN